MSNQRFNPEFRNDPVEAAVDQGPHIDWLAEHHTTVLLAEWIVELILLLSSMHSPWGTFSVRVSALH